MPMTTIEDVINAAASVATDAAEGRLSPSDLEAQLVTELKALVGNVVGPDDLLFELQCEIARGVLAVGGIPVDEQAEWLAVSRHQAGEPVELPEHADGLREPDPDVDPPTPISSASRPHRPESEAPEVITEPESVAEVVEVVEPAPPAAAPPRRDNADGYDPLRGWEPGGIRRH